MASDQPGLTVRIERRFAVERVRVFDALIVPGELRRWWGPRGFSTRILQFDPQPGGHYRIAMTPSDGTMFHLTGMFLAVAPPDRLEYTFRWEEPHPDDRETAVAIALAPQGPARLLTVAQGFFTTEARRELHRRGWSEPLDRLGELLAATG